jgi:hypothetical protein
MQMPILALGNSDAVSLFRDACLRFGSCLSSTMTFAFQSFAVSNRFPAHAPTPARQRM